MTKRQLRYYIKWEESNNVLLSQIYKKWSPAKEKAYWQVWTEYDENPLATDFRIISYNTFGFSVAWLVTTEDDYRLHICTPSGEDEFSIMRKR